MKNPLKTLKNTGKLLKSLKEINAQKILLGKLLSNSNAARTKEIIDDINKAEFQVFSQWGDDGIIDFLASYLDIKNKTFIEFGVETYEESNTRFLLINKNWTGYVMDGSAENIDYIKNDNIYWRYDINAKHAFITKENINTLLKEFDLNEEIGLLHIDIDGNEYWVWNEINVIKPVIVILEWNSMFGPNKPWTIPYKSDFYRFNEHYTGLYWGVSIKSLYDLAATKGYSLIGSNSNGNNLYFVRNDRLKDLKPKSPKDAYIESKYRESRDKDGNLTYIRGKNRLKQIDGMPIFNTVTNQLEKINSSEI